MELTRYGIEKRFEEWAANHVKTLKVYVLTAGQSSTCLGKVVGNINKSFDLNCIKARGYSLIEIDEDPRNLKSGFKERDTWTCRCEFNFIQSSALSKCPLCGCRITKQTNRLMNLNKVINWESQVI